MFRTKKDIDRHVQEALRKVKNEHDRNLRCYNIAKLYFMVGEYELARRYVSSYLSVREDSASAHKLLGEALENLGQKEKALAEYKCSLELESKQQDLVLKVCELLVDSESSIDAGRARYWCERAEQLFPHHPTVFRLKEHLLTADGEDDAAELEALIASELTARPGDVSLRVRLLRLYLDTERLTDAYNHAIEVENIAFPGFRDELQWYECLTDVFETYQEENSDKCDWEFHMHYVGVVERSACLSLQDHAVTRRSNADCVQALFSFDKALHQASNQTPPQSARELYQEFLKHARGQLCLHLATLVLKKAKKDSSNWRDACRVSSPLLLLALSTPIDLQATWLLQATETRKKLVDLWAKEVSYRNSQAGHVLLSMVHERKSQFLDKILQFCWGNWRERVFKRIFTTRDHQQGMPHSHFVNYSGFAEPPVRLPTATELTPHDEKSQKLYPDSLHHLVWLGLQDVSSSNKKYSILKPGPDFKCSVFEGLQLTSNNLSIAGAETLNRLDIDAFLYAAVFCASAAQEEQQAAGYWSADRPKTLPANIMEQLCTMSQANWWTAAYKVYTNQARGNLGELRMTLQRGIEVVRVLGNHGLDVKLIVQLARAFSERASAMAARTEAANEVQSVEERAHLYWTSALPLLERLQRNQTIRAPYTRLFEYQGKELSTAEVNALIEEGRFFLACQLMKEDKHEEAIEAFQQLKSPYASFYQATIYKKLAAEELEDERREMITSEMRSKHIILLTKARECYYLTLDRLRSPGVDAKHPLNAELNSHIEEIESQLSRIDPDVVGGDVNRNECDGMSDDSVSPTPSGADNLNNSLTGLGNSSSLYLQHLTPRHRASAGGHKHSSTPFRSNMHSDIALEHPRRTEARPSPERLDAQIRHLVHSKDSMMQTIFEQNKAVVDGLKEIKSVMEEIRNQIQELRKDTLKTRRQGMAQSNVNADLSQVCDPEDDLYVFDDEDYSEDVNLAAAQLGQYQAFPPYPPNYPNYRGMSSILGTPSGVGPYPTPHSGTQTPLLPPQPMGGFFRGVDPSAASLMYPPTLGYYAGQGALPFSEGQQLPNFGTAGPGLPTQAVSASVFSRLGGAADSPGASLLTHPSVAQHQQQQQQPVAPVNVVITSSDTLPTSAPPVQPTLSVTIPPQHLLGTPLISQPPAALHSTTSSAFTSGTVFNSTATGTTQSGVPHAFQISMPPQAQLPHAAILEKGAASLSPVLPISTGMLLSSVPSPVYSALQKSPAGKENTSVTANTSGGSAHRVSTGSAAGAEEEEGEDDADHDPCPDYQPVIPMPAEVELTTGEEEETVLFECRAKLFRYVEKEWKERGIGIMKLLHNQKSGKVRVLMRREQVLKICANHLLRSDMVLSPIKDRAWMWVALDFSDEEMRLEKLCIRFKTPDEAANFKDAFEKAKTLAVATETSPVKPPASVSSDPNSTTPHKITVGGFTFVSPPTFKVDAKSTIVQPALTDTTKEKEKSPGEAVKPSPFAAFSFTSSPKSSVGSEPALLRRPRTTVPKPVVSSSTDENKLMFDSPHSNLTFSALATEAKEPAFKKNDSFKGWEGTGTPVFGGSASKKSEAADENENECATEDFVPTAEFKPVVPLPELVDLKTGEEGETILFEERAKLLRFDSEGKQWKERGIGKMKIIENPATGKVRLLMRREQVLKVCCNHYVTTDLKFNALSTSDRAYTWYAQDYSEGETKPELLALKFKTADQAYCFKQMIDKVQLKLKEKCISVADQGKTPPQPEIWKCKECLFPNASDAAYCVSCKTARPRQPKETTGFTSSRSGSQPKLVELSKSAELWLCEGCSSKNSGQHDVCISCKKPKDKKPAVRSLNEVFKPKAGSWECKVCYVRNEGPVALCVACETPRPVSKVAESWLCQECSTNNSGDQEVCFNCKKQKDQKPAAKPLSELFKPKAGSWNCKDCYTTNDGSKIACVCCSAAKPGLEGKVEAEGSGNKSKFEFGIPSSGGTPQNSAGKSDFTFGIAPSAPVSEAVKFSFGIPPSTTTVTTTQSVFTTSSGATSKGGFTFGVQPLSSAVVSSTTSVSSTDNKATFLFGCSPVNTAAGDASSLTFSFGTGNSIASAQQESTTKEPGDGFTFGSSGNFKFHFRPKSPVKSPKSPGVASSHGDGEESGSELEEDEGEHIYFQPVIPLPDKVPVLTGEEEEDVLYCHRARLYRFVDGEWKERGVGDIKLLKHKTTQKIRLLMRRDQVLKLCLNHFLTKELQFIEKDEKSWLWSAQDFSEGQLQDEKFAVRFKNKDIAMDFKEAIDKAQDELKEGSSASTPAKQSPVVGKGAGPGDVSPAMKNFTFSLPAVRTQSSSTPVFSLSQFGNLPYGGCARSLFGGSSVSEPKRDVTGDEDDLEVIYELKVTPEEEAKAAALKLPLNFYSYLHKPPCPGCVGCESDSDVEPIVLKNLLQGSVTPRSVAVSTPSSTSALPQFSLFGTPSLPSTIFGTPSFGQPTSGSVFSKSSLIAAPKLEVSTSPQSAKTLFSPVALVTAPASADTSKPGGFNFGTPLGFKPAETPTTSAVFSFTPTTTPNAEAVESPKTEVAEEEGVPFLPSDPSLSFANLATKGEQPFKTEPSKNFLWAGAGSLVFGTTPKSTERKSLKGENGDDSSGDEGGADDSASNIHDPHFEPIIPLPPAVEVRTGEEEEVKVFCHRAKLYRYEAATKEWKERGVGEMKILHHPDKNKYRLILRREQVHKVVCNQLITPDLTLKPMSTSDRAWCWGALNHLEDGEPKVEELAVRFKFPEIAQEFKAKLEECIEQATKLAAAAPVPKESPSLVAHADSEGTDEDSEDEDAEDDVEDEDENEDDEEEDSEKTVMFEKRVTLLLQDPGSTEWKNQGLGDLQVVYDPEIYGARICVEQDGTGDQLCNTIISLNMTMEVVKRDCVWSGVDYTKEPPVQKTFKAKFSSEEAAMEFYNNFQEGKDLAVHSEILEVTNPADISPEED